MKNGFTLIELVFAIFILAVVVIGVYNSFSTIVIVTTGYSSRLTASYLTEEGIEIIRNMRDNNWLNGRSWTTGLSDANTNCLSGCEADYKTGTLPSLILVPWTSNGNYLNIQENNFYSYGNVGGFSPTKFKRKIIITPDIINPNVLKVSVLVIWQEKDEDFDMKAEEYLYNWY